MTTLVPLKHVTTVLSRGTAPDYMDDGPVRMISQAANQCAGLDWNRTRFHRFAGNVRKLRGFLEAGDVLINSTGTGTLGRIGWFDTGPDERPCVADGHVTVVRFDPALMFNRFGYYFLMSDAFQELMFETLVSGSTNQIELNGERMRSVAAPVPGVEEQRRIADFLDTETARIDRMVGLQQHVERRLEERDRAVLDQQIDQLIHENGVFPLRRAVLRVEQGASPLCDNVPAGESEWGVLKVSAVKAGRFEAGENKRLPSEMVPERRYEVREGDLLITRANTPALVGAAALVKRVPRRLLLCDKIFRVRLDSSLDKEFVALVARGSRIRDLCGSASHGTSQSMANLKIEEIKEWPIPAVDGPEQRRLVENVNRTQAATARLRALIARQLDLLAERRQALITAAVTGQLDVTTVRSVVGA